MYINCVYCGHCYGPEDDETSPMADVLKEHIEQCPKHPMSALKTEKDKLRKIVDDFISYFDPRGGISDVPLGPFERAQEMLKEL